jgi:hypothetical protein
MLSVKSWRKRAFRMMPVNILSRMKELKDGLHRNMRRAAMDRKYFASVLAGCGVS